MRDIASQFDDSPLRASIMFWLSLVFLALLACLIVLWIDVPRVAEPPDGELDGWELSETELQFEARAFGLGKLCAWAMLGLWPIFVLEQFVVFVTSASRFEFRERSRYWFLFILCPPFRLCPQNREGTDRIWLPSLGWQAVDDRFRRMLERRFSGPMLLIAILIIPVLGLEFFFKSRVLDYPFLRIALHASTGLIWFAFACEFIVMLSVANKKLAYCKKHWLDMVIILLPLLSFLRTLQIFRLSQVARAGKMGQLSKLVRAYRLRGVLMRSFRAFLLLEIAQRFRKPRLEQQILQIEDQIREKEQELAELHEQLLGLRSQINSVEEQVEDRST